MAKTRRQSAESRLNALEQTLVDVWHVAERCDGSRVKQQAALDDIQFLIELDMPDVNEYLPTSEQASGTALAVSS